MKVDVEGKLNSFDNDEKLGQLFMLGAYPTKGESDEKHVLNIIKKDKNYGFVCSETV